MIAALPPDTGPLDRIDAAVEAHPRFSLEISDYTTASIRNAGARHEILNETNRDDVIGALIGWIDRVVAS